MASLQEQIQDLTTAVQVLQFSYTRHEKSPRCSPTPLMSEQAHSVSPDRHDPSAGVCWYHCTFGAGARHCWDPCHWQETPGPFASASLQQWQDPELPFLRSELHIWPLIPG